MYDDMQKGRQAILESFEMLRQTNNQKIGLFAMSLINFAKADEYVNIFSQAPDNEKTTANKILVEVGPGQFSQIF